MRSIYWIKPGALPGDILASLPPDVASAEDVRLFRWEGRPAVVIVPSGVSAPAPESSMLAWVSNDAGSSWIPVAPNEIGRDAARGYAEPIAVSSMRELLSISSPSRDA